MYECRKQLFDSTYKRACTEQNTTINKITEVVDTYNSKIKEMSSINQDMRDYTDICHKESERRASYPEYSTEHVKYVAYIDVNSSSVLTQEGGNGTEEDIHENPYNKNEVNRCIGENASERIEQTMGEKIERNTSNQIKKITSKERKYQKIIFHIFPISKICLGSITNLLTTAIGKSLSRNMMTEELVQVSLLSEIRGPKKLSVVIAHLFSTHRESWNLPTIQPTIVHYNQATGWGNRERDYFTLGILYSGTDIQIRGHRRNINNRTGVYPQVLIITTIPESNSESNRNIFNSIIRTSDISYGGIFGMI